MTAPLSRRGFLGAAGVAALAIVSGCASAAAERKSEPRTPSPKRRGVGGITDPSKAPFDTVVVLMMENRSFDHLLGWVPGANGRQAGLSYPLPGGGSASTFPLGADTQGCRYRDPAHTWQAMLVHYDDGKCDGWLKTQPAGDRFPIGYYESEQLPVMGALARGYTLFDAYHSSLMAATWPNRLYALCAATDLDTTGAEPTTDAQRPSQLGVAIFDRLHQAGLSGGYYADLPITRLFASRRYDSITYPKDAFFAAAADGKLPNVTFIEPDYTPTPALDGIANDDHPHNDIETGEGFIADVYEALRHSPQWERMVFILSFDESGGFFDHVPPPSVVDDNVNPHPGPHPDFRRLGFRVPAIAMGPFAPQRIETAGPYEHCSVLRMIEWRWALPPMTARDAHARNLAEALDFAKMREPITLPPFQRVTPEPCAAQSLPSSR